VPVVRAATEPAPSARPRRPVAILRYLDVAVVVETLRQLGLSDELARLLGHNMRPPSNARRFETGRSRGLGARPVASPKLLPDLRFPPHALELDPPGARSRRGAS
jgi:hypothetical protein